jgi:hypothetical protein
LKSLLLKTPMLLLPKRLLLKARRRLLSNFLLEL